MKKQGSYLLLAVCAVFLVATVGIFIGRNAGSQSIHVAPLSLTAGTEPTFTQPDALLVDINTADAQQLQQLPGIGDVLAGRILDYREERGSFTSLEQLLDVEGIGAGRLEELLPYITIGGAQ